MEINRNNYEIFFLDYLDGNLKKEDTDRFLDFVNQNPDLKEELEGIGNVKLPAEEISFDNKESLYKSEDQKADNEDFMAVAYMEGDLSEPEKSLFLKQLKSHPEKAGNLELMMKTRLHPDETIVFPAKKKLYRKSSAQQFVYWGIRAAAILLLVFAFRTVLDLSKNRETISRTETLARNNNQTAVQTEKAEPVKPEPQLETDNISEAVEAPELPEENKTEKPVAVNKRVAPVVTPKQTPLPATGQMQPLQLRSVQLLPENRQQPALAGISTKTKNDESDYYTLDSYFAEKVLHIKKSDKPENKSLLESGLDLAGNVSGKRISYKTEEGKVSKISFDSRILAFSVPVKNNK